MIPALAFNDAKTHLVTDAIVAGENLARAYRKLNEFSSLNGGRKFSSKTAFIKINELSLSAASAGGLCLETDNNQNYFLVLSLTGRHTTTISGTDYQYRPGSSGLFAVCEKQRSINSGSGAAMHFQTEKLSLTYNAMFGSHRHSPLPANPQVLSLEVGGILFLDLFKNLFMQIDRVDGDTNILSKLGLDDAFYRLCIGLLHPDLFLTDETRNGKRPYVRPEIHRLCEYIAANLTEAVSLTEMESRSGLSARILQRSFQNTFGVTPKQWVRQQRLHAARNVLLNRREPISITALAYDFCFASPSAFAHHYLLEFGERPSQTLCKKIISVPGKSSVDFWK